MAKRPEKPDFIADQFGNVQDVRHLKHLRKPAPTPSQHDEDEKPDSLSSHAAAAGGIGFLLLGGVLIVAGIALYVGNASGKLPTLPYAG